MAAQDITQAADAVERAITLAVEREQWDRNGSLYVSDVKHALSPDAGGDCKAKLYAKLRDEPQQPLKPGVEMMFSMGDTIHERVVDWLKEHLPEDWYVADVEERAREGIEPLRGRLDIAIRRPDRLCEIVIDVKTKRGNAFHYLDSPKPADVLQVQCYIESREHAVGGLLVYVDREGQNFIKVFGVEPDPEAVRNAINRLVDVREYAQRNDEPAAHWLLEPKVTRNLNKGRDSVKVSWPWQVEWCNLQTCYCKDAAPDSLKNCPSGIIGWVEDDGTVEVKEKYRGTYLQAYIESRIANGNYDTA